MSMINDKKVMEVDRVAYAIILNSLINMKNEMLEQEKETDLIDKVIVKIIKAPSKQKKGVFHKKKEARNEAR